MLLRDVELNDVDAYIRMRCDPLMMAELGGPLPSEDMEAKVQRDVQLLGHTVVRRPQGLKTDRMTLAR